MKLEQLEERRASIAAQAESTAQVFHALKGHIAELDYLISEMKKVVEADIEDPVQ